jgi:simple sugar transport system ATP-binding protein
VRDASLEVRRGEIVGIAGVEGNGQRELALLLSGRLPPDTGRAHLPSAAGFVPQDRTTEGLIGAFDLVGNVALALHDRDEGGGWLMPWAEAWRRAEEIRSTYGVQARDVTVRASALSGGNQQRLVVGRELGRARDLLVAENPTRGLDIAATAFVRGELSRRVGGSSSADEPEAEAPGIVLISSDLHEVLALSHRVFVMVRGRLVPVPESRLSREGIGAMMLGASA